MEARPQVRWIQSASFKVTVVNNFILKRSRLT
jgi:hypothetical protein